MCERRGDAFYIMDIAPNQTAGAAAIKTLLIKLVNLIQTMQQLIILGSKLLKQTVTR
jgi:hypothetical protein